MLVPVLIADTTVAPAVPVRAEPFGYSVIAPKHVIAMSGHLSKMAVTL